VTAVLVSSTWSTWSIAVRTNKASDFQLTVCRSSIRPDCAKTSRTTPCCLPGTSRRRASASKPNTAGAAANLSFRSHGRRSYNERCFTGMLKTETKSNPALTGDAIPVFKPLIQQQELDAAVEALEMGWLGMG